MFKITIKDSWTWANRFSTSSVGLGRGYIRGVKLASQNLKPLIKPLNREDQGPGPGTRRFLHVGVCHVSKVRSMGP